MTGIPVLRAGRVVSRKLARLFGTNFAAAVRLRRDALKKVWTQGRPFLPLWRAAIPLRSYRRALPRDKVVMLVVSALRIDPRVERAARSAVRHGYRVTVVAPDISTPTLETEPLDWGPGISFRILPGTAAEYVSRPPWLAGEEMYLAAISEPAALIHCHDLTTALIGLAAARKTGSRCVCDFHEWWSENVSWSVADSAWIPHPAEKKFWLRMAERVALMNADAIITVCDSIAVELSTLGPWKRRIDVIRNIPSLKGSGAVFTPLRDVIGAKPDHFVLLWQGGTGPSRLLEPVIESLKHEERLVLVIRGPSLEYFGEAYTLLARSLGVEDRLVLLPPVRSADVVDAARDADAGIWTLPNLSKNFYYALPNKIFEYMAAGIPVLVADYPEARRMIVDNEVGLAFDPYDPKSIAAAVRRLIDEPGLARRLRSNIPDVLRKIDAEHEWDKLAQVYRRVLPRGKNRQA